MMNLRLEIIIALIFQFGIKLTCSQEGTSTTQEKPFSYTLDFKNQTRWPFVMPPVDQKYEDWFYYYENLTPAGQTPAAKEYFKDLDFAEIKSAEGVWVAFFTEKPSPIFDEEFPLISFESDLQRLQSLEIRYYIHAKANITLYEGVNHTLESTEVSLPKWETSVFNLETSHFQLFLCPNAIGDFILIDKISLEGIETVTTTTSTTTTTKGSTTIIIDSSTESTTIEVDDSVAGSSTTDLVINGSAMFFASHGLILTAYVIARQSWNTIEN